MNIDSVTYVCVCVCVCRTVFVYLLPCVCVSYCVCVSLTMCVSLAAAVLPAALPIPYEALQPPQPHALRHGHDRPTGRLVHLFYLLFLAPFCVWLFVSLLLLF